jgi:hypothetical protein
VTAATATLAGRRAADGLMTDTCTITRGNPNPGPFDTVTGTYSTPAATVIYTGKCRARGSARFDKVVDAGGQPITLYRFTVSLPVDGTVFHVDDIVLLTSSALDPALAGLLLRVREPEFGSQITARRLGCEVNAG